MKRSFELTRNRFWQTFRFGLTIGLLIVTPWALIALPVVFIPALDHWLIEAAAQLTCDVISAFGTVALLCGYEAFSDEPGNA
jgi:hypothetical protein